MASSDVTVHVTLDDAELQEALQRLDRETMRAWIRMEVRKALQDITREMGIRAVCPPRHEVQDLPAWTRHEETGGTH